jgi:hypothetical protein
MDNAIKLKTADISAAAEATCHFMVTLSPSIERDPDVVLWQYFENALGLITKRSRGFLLFLCASQFGSMRRPNARPARGAASQPCADDGKKGCYKEPTIKDAEAGTDHGAGF